MTDYPIIFACNQRASLFNTYRVFSINPIITVPKANDFIFIISKALYGLRSSGLRWHEKFAECLRGEGFIPSKGEPDIWMRENNGIYEYVAVYVDDLAFAMKEPAKFVKVLTEQHKFKLKGTGPLEFHLGCDFYRDDNKTLCMAPKKYITRMHDTYVRLFGSKAKLNVFSLWKRVITRNWTNLIYSTWTTSKSISLL